MHLPCQENLQLKLILKQRVAPPPLLSFQLSTRGPWATSLTWETGETVSTINTFAKSYDYTITLINRKKSFSPGVFKNWIVLYLLKLKSPSTKDALCQVWLKVDKWYGVLKMKMEKVYWQTTSNQRSSLKNHATLLSQFLHYVMWYVVYSNKKHLSIISQLNLFPKHASQSGTKSILTKHLSSKYVAINNSTSSTRYRK